MSLSLRPIILGLLLGTTPLLQAADRSAATTTSPPPRFERVLILVLENSDYRPTALQSEFSHLAAEGALLTNYRALGHPSQLNYIGLVAGDTLGVNNNHRLSLPQRHLGDLLDAAGIRWKLYAEGYPGGCFLGGKSKRYVRKHVPFLSFRNVADNPRRCAEHVAPATELQRDRDAGRLPQLILYIPDQQNNGHDSSVEFAGRWLQRQLDQWQGTPILGDDTLLVVTFDEGEDEGDNRVWTWLSGPMVRAGSHSDTPYSHYSLLRTLEENWALGTLGRLDAEAQPIDDVWQDPPSRLPTTGSINPEG